MFLKRAKVSIPDAGNLSVRFNVARSICCLIPSNYHGIIGSSALPSLKVGRTSDEQASYNYSMYKTESWHTREW